MSQVQEIKEHLDILEIIGQRIQLQRSGKNFRALCPFHSEKSPSFFVSPELQTFKCFGCGRHGDVFTFIQEFDRLTFPETLELLAKEAGIELKQEFADPQEQQRRRILELLDLAAKYYSYLLNEHKVGETGRVYLESRQVGSKLSKRFDLGFAPEDWDQLTNYLTKKKKFTAEEIEQAGLGISGQRGVYDRFRGRLMFPLHDHRGRVVGFSGRLLDAKAKEAKYINTPETLVYHKRYLLFGYHQNLESIREEEAVIVMEGEFDVLSSVQAHVKHVVAVKGSVLTPEQVRILARTVKTIYLALDADSAGVEATKRAIEVVQGFPVALRIIPLTGGKDPDEHARQDPAGWRAQVQEHISAFDYVLDHTLAQHDLKTAQGQKVATDTMLQLILKIDHPVEREFYLKALADRVGVSSTVLEEQLQRLNKQQVLPRAKSTTEVELAPQATPTEEYLWQLATRITDKAVLLQLTTDLFGTPLYKRLTEKLQQYLAKHEAFELGAFAQSLPEELQTAVTQLYLPELPLAETQYVSEFEWTLKKQQEQYKKQRQQEISHRLSELEKLGPPDEKMEEYQSLQAEFIRLTK